MYGTLCKDRDLLCYCFYCFSTVSYAFLLFPMVFYYFRMQKLARGVAPQSLSQVHALTLRRYMYDHQVEEAECTLCGANVHRLLHVPHGHGTGHGKDSVKTVTYATL